MTTKTLLTLCVLLFSVSISFGQEDFLTLNGKKVEVLTAGLENNQVDKPVIVFENGRGSTFDSWENIIAEFSKESAVFAYNRPRIGNSEDDNRPPRMKYIVDNLREMLLMKGLKPPYLLVAHSFGACYIRSFASYYPEEIAGLIFVDPHDFTKKKGFGRFPYQEIGLTEHQIDSIFATYAMYSKQFLANGPKHHVEEVKIQKELGNSGHAECTHNPLPDVPVHILLAGGFTLYPDETPTVYDREEMFRIDSNIKMKRWLKLLYTLKYGKFFYSSNSGHAIQEDDPGLVISSIKMALKDFSKMKKKSTANNGA